MIDRKMSDVFCGSGLCVCVCVAVDQINIVGLALLLLSRNCGLVLRSSWWAVVFVRRVFRFDVDCVSFCSSCDSSCIWLVKEKGN